MKVRVQFTVEIDADKYCAEYGQDLRAAEIRREINEDAEQSVIAWLERVGVPVEVVS